MKAPTAVLILLLAFALLFSLGCAQQAKSPQVNEEAQEQGNASSMNAREAEEQPCSSGNVLQKDECFASLAKKSMDQKYCRNIYSIDKLDECYFLFAGSDLEACKKISNPQMKWNCLLANAKMEKSEEICRLIENDSMRAECLKAVLPPCMLILDESKRALCFAVEKGNPSLCTNDWCLFEYAKNKTDPSACGLISQEFARYACTAIVKGEISICSLSEKEPLRDACYMNYSIETGTPSGCDLATAGSSYANSCYLHFAVKYNDAKYCKKPLQEGQRDECYSDFAKLTANASACSKVINTLNKLGCYRAAAIWNRMPSLCNDIETAIGMRDCYAASILYVDAGPLPSDCKNVKNDDWRNKCYYIAAIKENNGTYCEFASDGPDKEECNKIFKK
jgi:hypothetical protein